MRIRPLRWLLARSDQAGVFAASAITAGTFQRTLMPRSNADQAVVTGLSMTLSYLLAGLVQDVVESTSSWLLFGSTGKSSDQDERQLRRITLGVGVAGFIAGLVPQMAFPQRSQEPVRLAAARSAGWWLATGSFSGVSVGLLQELFSAIDERRGPDSHLKDLPVSLIGGSIFSAIRHVQLSRTERKFSNLDEFEEMRVSAVRALPMAAAGSLALTGFVLLNRTASTLLGRALDRYLPGDERLWRPIAHMGLLASLGGVLYTQLHRINSRIEEGAGKIEGAFENPPASSLVSGSAASHVAWETLSREGRRHVSTAVPRESISVVMGESAMEPIRVYVGLDSAPTEEERIALAARELERTGAFERKLLIAVSPTGTGYVNYVAIDSAEYMALGNCSTVTLQYSKRPSPLSLDRVWEGRRQFRMLLAAIRRRLYQMAPETRPRLVVFGESLGAHTSQDAFLNTGTQGLLDAGVERALWIGTPHLSKWKVQVMGSDRLDVERPSIAEFDSFDQVERLSDEARAQLRYVLVTHGNDGVGRFGLDLLIQKPEWLGDPETRPPGVPKSQRWVTPTTFVQTLIDMNNAMNVVPGEFEAKGHDYRADLARFVREVYQLPCSDDQLERIELALREREVSRETLIKQDNVPPSDDAVEVASESPPQ